MTKGNFLKLKEAYITFTQNLQIYAVFYYGQQNGILNKGVMYMVMPTHYLPSNCLLEISINSTKMFLLLFVSQVRKCSDFLALLKINKKMRELLKKSFRMEHK